MKAGCSLDRFFTNNFFPFDLWIWISLIKSSSDFLRVFSLSPAPPATLVFVVPMTSLFSCLALCAGLTVSHFFVLPMASITPRSPDISLLLQLLFQQLRWCLLWPRAPSPSSPGLDHQLSIAVVQASSPALSLPYAFSPVRSIELVGSKDT